MTIGEIIQRVQSLYSKGVESDDSRLSSRHIYNKLLSSRSKLISQKANKKQNISSWNYQTLPCVNLIKVPAHECPCFPPVGCEVLRSEYKLPDPISGLSGVLIKSVTSIERSLKIDAITINAVNSQKGNKYTSKKTNYFIQDGYLYITTPTNLKVVSIIGLFEDPIDAISYCNSCTGCINCLNYKEEEFPISSDLVDALIELTVIEVIQIFSKRIEDATNNTRDNIAQQTK
mgnify:CR=1 FL=1